MQVHNPSHPGRILAYYLQSRTVTDVARHLGVTRPALSRVLNGKAGISADMALRISEAFGTEPDLWLRLQAQRDLWVASQKKRKKVKRKCSMHMGGRRRTATRRFFICAFAEDYDPLPHTLQEKGSSMERNPQQQKRGAPPYSLVPIACSLFPVLYGRAHP
jgi:addiction module HigA family antidote